MIPVDPADCNWQVSCYMALRHLIYGLDALEYEIDQPWNDEDEGYQRHSRVELEGAALAQNVTTLEEYINDSLNDQGILNTGKHCKYCVGLACPAIRQIKDTMKMRLTPEMLAQVKREMPDGELVDLVAEASTLTKPIEDVRELLKGRLEGGKVLTSDSGLTAKVVESPGGYHVVDPVGMFKWVSGQLAPEILAPALGYPSGRIRDALAKGLNIPKTGKSGITAQNVFEGAAAAYLEPKTKKSLILS